MATQIRVFLEKHNGRVTGGSYFRTRKGALIGRGVAAKLFRGEECEVPAKMWADANFRKDVYNGLRLPGYQVIPRFELIETPDEPAPVTVTTIETPASREPEQTADVQTAPANQPPRKSQRKQTAWAAD